MIMVYIKVAAEYSVNVNWYHYSPYKRHQVDINSPKCNLLVIVAHKIKSVLVTFQGCYNFLLYLDTELFIAVMLCLEVS